jgi:hypothetical protein
MEKTESYLSKDYLLLTSRSNKNKTIKSEDAVVQEKEELRTLPDPQPVQMPTTIAADMGTMPRIVDKLDKVLFIDEGHDRTEDVYLALHAERLLLARGHDAAQQSTYDMYPEAGDKLGYNQLLDAALLMREQ